MLKWAYCLIMHYNIYLGIAKKTSIFIKKIILNAGTGMRRGYLNPSGMGMGFTFSSPLGMSWVTGKYMRIGYGDGECKTRPHPAPLPCLIVMPFFFCFLLRQWNILYLCIMMFRLFIYISNVNFVLYEYWYFF